MSKSTPLHNGLVHAGLEAVSPPSVASVAAEGEFTIQAVTASFSPTSGVLSVFGDTLDNTMSVSRNAAGNLLVMQQGIFGTKRREWPVEAIESIGLGPSGMKVNDRDVLQLQVHAGGEKLGLLTGRDETELEWLACELRCAWRIDEILRATKMANRIHWLENTAVKRGMTLESVEAYAAKEESSGTWERLERTDWFNDDGGTAFYLIVCSKA